jgi:hypothetical protein
MPPLPVAATHDTFQRLSCVTGAAHPGASKTKGDLSDREPGARHLNFGLSDFPDQFFHRRKDSIGGVNFTD